MLYLEGVHRPASFVRRWASIRISNWLDAAWNFGSRSEVENEDIGIHKHCFSTAKLGQIHALSCGSSSGSRAKYASFSLVPVHPRRPAVASTQFAGVCTITVNFFVFLKGVRVGPA
jgi:hypothetical protein